MQEHKRGRSRLIVLLAGPVLSLITFVVAYFVDPLNFGNGKQLAAVPSLLVSIVVLLIGHNVAALHELEVASEHSGRIYEAVKDYLHVTKVGSPEIAMQYVASRLPILREVRNTTFNLKDEVERSSEKLYDTSVYEHSERKIAEWTGREVRWKDIGDTRAADRLRRILGASEKSSTKHKSGYQFKLLARNEPQINFTVLTYPDGSSEVLFNWDFRNAGQDPTVLLSRDRDIVEMFSIQFEDLWRVSTVDHDSQAKTAAP
jgi:hypothetical protein